MNASDRSAQRPDPAEGASGGWRRRRGQEAQLAALQTELAAALERAARAEQALAAASEDPERRDPETEAEEILRLAGAQARETQAAAAREASALMARAHAEVERHRRRGADDLAARSAEADKRDAELDAREARIAQTAEAERHAIEVVRSAALAEADRIRRAALVAADDIRRRSTAEAMSYLRAAERAAQPPDAPT